MTALAEAVDAGGEELTPAVYVRADGRAYDSPIPLTYLTEAVSADSKELFRDTLAQYRGGAPAHQAVRELRTKTPDGSWAWRCEEAAAHRWGAWELGELTADYEAELFSYLQNPSAVEPLPTAPEPWTGQATGVQIVCTHGSAEYAGIFLRAAGHYLWVQPQSGAARCVHIHVCAKPRKLRQQQDHLQHFSPRSKSTTDGPSYPPWGRNREVAAAGSP